MFILNRRRKSGRSVAIGYLRLQSVRSRQSAIGPSPEDSPILRLEEGTQQKEAHNSDEANKNVSYDIAGSIFLRTIVFHRVMLGGDRNKIAAKSHSHLDETPYRQHPSTETLFEISIGFLLKVYLWGIAICSIAP
jgi:hypothetical protein